MIIGISAAQGPSQGAHAIATHPIRASYYADKFEGHRTASGRRFHQSELTAASKHFPLGTLIRITSTATGKSVVLPVTDRGPWSPRYQLDLSKAAFRALGLDTRKGWAWVTVSKASPASFEDDD